MTVIISFTNGDIVTYENISYTQCIDGVYKMRGAGVDHKYTWRIPLCNVFGVREEEIT